MTDLTALDTEYAVHKMNEALLRRLSVNVRALRTAAGLTLKEAAEQSGVSFRHWQRIEAREANVSMAILVKMARVLRVDVPELFGALELLEPPESGSVQPTTC